MPLKTVVIGLLTTVLVAELSCLIFSFAFESRLPFFRPERLTSSNLDLRSSYDSELGWDTHYPTLLGERPRERTYGRPLLAAFGDSFTAGIEVGNFETWEEYLSFLVKRDVYNFGVGTYGTDQAYLKFKRVFKPDLAPLAALGLITENINRIVNVYRPFYFDATGLPLSKPRFDIGEAGLKLLPNPLPFPEMPIHLEHTALEKMGVHDWWWHKRHSMPVLKFPYANLILKRTTWLWALYKWRRSVSDINPRPWEDLWSDEQPRKLLFAIVDSFVSDSVKLGARPVVILFPQKFELVQRIAGRDSVGAQALLAHCAERHYTCFDGIGALAGAGDPEALYTQHFTPFGNRIFAQRFAAFLRQQNLLDP